jgi:type VI secretion system protein ImpC
VAPDVAEVHAALRASPAASWVGLALPRVILRQPYGVGSDEIDSFDFEEMTPANDHETYLWGNPAFAVALLVGRAFIDNGWEMEPGDELDLSDLPSHVYASGGEKKTKPCAEVLLSDRAVDVIIKAGLMPMVSFRNRNAVRAERLQSVASPSAALSGPWG